MLRRLGITVLLGIRRQDGLSARYYLLCTSTVPHTDKSVGLTALTISITSENRKEGAPTLSMGRYGESLRAFRFRDVQERPSGLVERGVLAESQRRSPLQRQTGGSERELQPPSHPLRLCSTSSAWLHRRGADSLLGSCSRRPTQLFFAASCVGAYIRAHLESGPLRRA